MKSTLKFMRLLSVMFMMIAFLTANAQDVIVKTNGDEIKAKVEEVTENAIKYRNASNPTGPLYSISRASVASIRYENGYVDEFSAANAKAEETVANPNEGTGVSDDELLKMAGGNAVQSNSNSLSDSDLNRLYTQYKYGDQKTTFEGQMKKAKRLKLTGWIGGAILAAAGLGIGVWVGEFNYDVPYYMAIIGGPGVVAGAIWCVSFNLAANNVIKKAKEQQLYSATIFESEIINCGQNARLCAGIDLLGNRMTNEHTLGLGLKLNF